MPIRTALVDVAEIFALRHSVLLPGRPPAEAEFAEDTAPGAFHLAAYDAGGVLAACVSFCPERLPGDDTPAHRFRGMASTPAARGRGYGVAVLEAGLAESSSRGAELVWCNARTSARGFYLKRGFEVRGEEFEIAGVGPHVVMTTKLAPRP